MQIMRPVTLLGFALAATLPQALAGSGQAQIQTSQLTVPQDRLPKGCRLALGPEMPGMYKENPWSGSSGPRLAGIRASIEGPPPVSGDILKRDENLTRSAEHVLDAYTARYLAGNEGWIAVSAVRFDDPKWTTAAAAIRLEGETPRIVVGSIAIHVARSTQMTRTKPTDLTQSCYEAVRKYISALSRPRG